MHLEAGYLKLSRLGGVVVIQPGFANPHHLGVGGDGAEVLNRNLWLFVDMQGVAAGGKEDAIVFSGYDFFEVWLLLMLGQIGMAATKERKPRGAYER